VALPAPSVSDNCDPNPVLGNDAPALFPIGKTVVTVTATDFSGNTNEDQLTVTVVGYDEYLGRILQELQKMDLDHGTVNAFENKVVSIQEALDRGKCREAKERLESLLRHIIEEWGKLKNLNREQSELLYDMVFKLWRTVEPCC
jgi:hypothetical protein